MTRNQDCFVIEYVVKHWLNSACDSLGISESWMPYHSVYDNCSQFNEPAIFSINNSSEPNGMLQGIFIINGPIFSDTGQLPS